MGIFKRVKNFFGATALTVDFKELEQRIPVTDTGVKYQIELKSKTNLTVVSVRNELVAAYRNKEGIEKRTILADEIDAGEKWIANQNPFPGNINEDNNWQYTGAVFMRKKRNTQLQDLYKNKAENHLKLLLILEIDIKETGVLFDPVVEKEIELLPPKV